jgi:hypothetical protein
MFCFGDDAGGDLGEHILLSWGKAVTELKKTQVIGETWKINLTMYGACKLLRVLPGGFIIIVTLFLKVCGVGNKKS